MSQAKAMLEGQDDAWEARNIHPALIQARDDATAGTDDVKRQVAIAAAFYTAAMFEGGEALAPLVADPIPPQGAVDLEDGWERDHVGCARAARQQILAEARRLGLKTNDLSRQLGLVLTPHGFESAR